MPKVAYDESTLENPPRALRQCGGAGERALQS